MQNESGRSGHQGDAHIELRCAAWHATDPHLTAARERQLARQIVDVPFVNQETLAAARMAVRMHWPVEAVE
jgi:hypothetical protein